MRGFRKVRKTENFDDERTVAIGRIVKPHGLKGEVKVYPLTNLEDLFEEDEDVIIFNPKSGWKKRAEIEKVRKMNKLMILKLSGYDLRNDAERLRGYEIRLEKSRLPEIGEWEYYVFQLIDCEVFYEDGSRIGKIVDVIETGSNDVIVVEDEEGEEEIFPMIRDYVVKLDLDEKKVVVRKLKWYEGNE